MIQKVINEYAENNTAIYTSIVFFLGIPIYKSTYTTTNNSLLETLEQKKKPVKIKGFKHENKSKVI